MAANQAALRILINASVVISVSRVAARIPFSSSTMALSMRSTLVDKLDALAEAAPDDAVYAEVSKLRSAVVEHLTKTAANLPRIVPYTPPATVPWLVLSQRLYGSTAMAQDLIDRNGIEDPTRVPGGVPLEVISG
jgi:prophage DNA circulation protein